MLRDTLDTCCTARILTYICPQSSRARITNNNKSIARIPTDLCRISATFRRTQTYQIVQSKDFCRLIIASESRSMSLGCFRSAIVSVSIGALSHELGNYFASQLHGVRINLARHSRGCTCPFRINNADLTMRGNDAARRSTTDYTSSMIRAKSEFTYRSRGAHVVSEADFS